MTGALIVASAVVAPLASSAADRSDDGAVVVYATHGAERGIGAGTIVGRTGSRVRVLTAKHVATYGTLAVEVGDGIARPARVLATLPDRDLAVVETDVPEAEAATLHVAPVAVPRDREAVRIWGSGADGPALESGAVARVGADLPDGAANGRYALGCALCHRGDSGAGIFNARGELVGVYIGYFTVDTGRVQIAERSDAAATLANADALVASQPPAERAPTAER